MERRLEDDLTARLARSSRATLEFLHADLNLGFTFCEVARLEADFAPVTVHRLTERVRSVIRTVELLKGRVEAHADRLEITLRVAQLQDELANLNSDQPASHRAVQLRDRSSPGEISPIRRCEYETKPTREPLYGG